MFSIVGERSVMMALMIEKPQLYAECLDITGQTFLSLSAIYIDYLEFINVAAYCKKHFVIPFWIVAQDGKICWGWTFSPCDTLSLIKGLWDTSGLKFRSFVLFNKRILFFFLYFFFSKRLADMWYYQKISGNLEQSPNYIIVYIPEIIKKIANFQGCNLGNI